MLPYDMFLIGKGNQFHLRFHLTYIFLSYISWFKLSEWIIKKFGHSRIPCKALPQQGQTTGAKCHVIGYNDCCVIAVLDSFSVQLCVHKNLNNKLKLFSLQNSVLRINKNFIYVFSTFSVRFDRWQISWYLLA